MNARDIIKLAAQLYVYDALKCVARGNLMASVLVEEFNSEVKKIKENYEV